VQCNQCQDYRMARMTAQMPLISQLRLAEVGPPLGVLRRITQEYCPDLLRSVHRSYSVRAKTMSASPVRKLANIAANKVDVPGGAVRNSFQMNTPQNAATIVAPWPSP